MRRLHLLCILLLAGALAAQQQPDTEGLSPKAGAVSENRSLTVTAEAGPMRPDHVASAALILEQSGARKLAGMQEIDAGTRKLYRADYRSQLINSDLYQAIIAMPTKHYLVVFTFTAEDRKQLDSLADALTKDLSFAVGKSSSQ
jgi:hypothetical protein